MINLLPPKQKQELSQEDDLRLVFILGTLFMCFLICLSLILFLIKNSTLGDLEAQKLLVQDKEDLVSLNRDLEEQIKEYNTLFTNLNSFYNQQLSVSSLVDKIASTLPSGIYLTNFNFTSIKTAGELNISMSGFCPDRKTLLVFQENLKKEKGFCEVIFSPQSWVEPTNINFSVNLKFENDSKE